MYATPPHELDLPQHRRHGGPPPPPASLPDPAAFDGDGKRVRKPVHRRTVDYTSTAVRWIQTRMWQRDWRDSTVLQPTPLAAIDLLPSVAYADCPATSFATKFVHASTNKVRCSINKVLWAPSGRRLITGSQSGEFTLWNGQSFNFEIIIQAHDEAIGSMVWSHNENWMVTGDEGGCIKYWQTNMNNVKANKAAHTEAVRDLSFSSTDLKFCSCSDDTTVKVWDFARCQEERSLAGHGWDVKSVDWHPQKSLLVSGAKDHLVKLWDAKTGRQLRTLHGHKNTVLSVRWNSNGNWVLTASKDQIIKLYDIRTLKELESYRGHQKDVTCLAWHPFHEDLFVSGSYDGTIMHWLVGHEVPQAEVNNAHESSVLDLAWHPMGHILCSGSNDHTTKFWCRNRPGDAVREKHGMAYSHGMVNEQTLPVVGDPPTSLQSAEGPVTPGAFASGGPVRGEGAIPGVGMAMPLVQPPMDTGVTADAAKQHSVLGTVPSGMVPRGPHPPSTPYPSLMSSTPPLFQQVKVYPQQQPPQQSLLSHQQQQQQHQQQVQLQLPPAPPLPPPRPVAPPLPQQPPSEPLLARPGLAQTSAPLVLNGQMASLMSMQGSSSQLRPQLGPSPALGVPSVRPISGNQALSPFQGSGTGGDFIASGGLQSGGLTLSGGQPYRANLAGLQGHTPGLLPPMGAPPYPGLAGPPLPSPMTSTTDAFQGGGLPGMMDLRMNMGLQMGMGMNPPHSHGPGQPQL